MKKQPLVSVIIPTYNRKDFLVKAVDSVLNQSYKKIEVLVVDDGSDVHPLKFLKKDSRIRILDNACGKGAPGSKNTGIAASKGEIITYLDDDDLLNPAAIKKSVSLLNKMRHIGVVFMGVKYFGVRGKESEKIHQEALSYLLKRMQPTQISKSEFVLPKNWFDSLILSVPIDFQRPVVRRETLNLIGGYTKDCLLWDNDWAIRASMFARSALIKEPLNLTRIGSHNWSSIPQREEERKKSHKEIINRIHKLVKKERRYSSFLRPLIIARSKDYFNKGYDVRQMNKLRALIFYLISMFKHYDPIQIKAIKKLFIPGYYKNK